MRNIALYQLVWTASLLIRSIILYQGPEFRQEFGSLESSSQGVDKPADIFHPQGASGRRPKLEEDEESLTKRQRILLQGQQPTSMLDLNIALTPEPNLESVRAVTNHPGTPLDQPRKDGIPFYPVDQSVPRASMKQETLVHREHPPQENDSHQSGSDGHIQAQLIQNPRATLPQPPFVDSQAESSSDPMAMSQTLGWVPSSFSIVRGFYLPVSEVRYKELAGELETTVQSLGVWQYRLGKPIVDKKFDYLPVDMVSYPGHPAKVIRFLDKNYDHASIRDSIWGTKGLFQRMVYNHRLSSSQLESAPIQPHQRLKEQGMILRWFKTQLNDAADSLPVLGEVKSFQLGKGFGPVQRWIIWYLHHGDEDSFGHTTSIALLWSWYKSQAPSKWEKLELHRQELRLDSFWTLMHHYAKKTGPGAGWCKVKSFSPPSYSPSFLGELSLEGFRESTKHYNNLFFKFTADPTEIGTHKTILDKLPEAYKPYRPMDRMSSSDLELKRFFGINSLLEPFRHSETNEKMFAIRPTDSTGKVIEFEDLNKSLEYLLGSCRWWHENLNLGLKAHGIEPIDNAHQKFLDWLQEILYGTKHSLPVFGLINQETHDLLDGQPAFACVPRFLNHHLSSNSSPQISTSGDWSIPPGIATDSMTLIVYWIYSNHLELWSKNRYYPTAYIQYFIDGLKINQRSLAR
ncbi:hypothetical protein Pst134EA_025451 [Puccinia striiformis f. sp. tritici]|uniref:hypothetical protein n=1 Tax=Puccinia striiformis f. sp. tritici TaxID=168172 RepID=UPI00200796E2|nr:hypothetical protein Pst134EA_025451 [Puccinia striiformis f. sp. tritici]KAH9451497.1 hypothetical protein Pst134EA_025451 [Puccinia striiformis f. sp. tritici]KAI9613001.1 hypothetical protein H4Q26_010272 [Puccinia striiformis f. sp. tritici PST-130]